MQHMAMIQSAWRPLLPPSATEQNKLLSRMMQQVTQGDPYAYTIFKQDGKEFMWVLSDPILCHSMPGSWFMSCVGLATMLHPMITSAGIQCFWSWLHPHPCCVLYVIVNQPNMQFFPSGVGARPVVTRALAACPHQPFQDWRHTSPGVPGPFLQHFWFGGRCTAIVPADGTAGAKPRQALAAAAAGPRRE
jgi:hypothetical protein